MLQFYQPYEGPNLYPAYIVERYIQLGTVAEPAEGTGGDSVDEVVVQVDDFRIRWNVRRDIFEALFRMIVALHTFTRGFRHGNEQSIQNCV